MAPSVQPVTTEIRFFDPAANEPVTYTFAIIISRYQGQWVWVKHNERNTWELPAGHLESGEAPLEAAQRELYEETGAVDYTIDPVVSYEGIYQGKTVYGMIFLARILKLRPLPDFEIGEIGFFEGIPDELTYPQIQPAFFNYTLKNMDEKGFTDLTALPNIGITLAENLITAGIMNPGELFELGTEKAFQRIRSFLPDACLSQLYAIEGAIQGVRWDSLESGRREELRRFFNQLNPSSL